MALDWILTQAYVGTGGQGADLITEESAVHWEMKSALDVFAGSLDCPHITDFTPPQFPIVIGRADRGG